MDSNKIEFVFQASVFFQDENVYLMGPCDQYGTLEDFD